MKPRLATELARITPTVPAPDWGRASCSGTDNEAFFATGADAELAKRVCAICEIRIPCLEWALVTDQRHGVWGGMHTRQRQRIHRQRQQEAAHA